MKALIAERLGVARVVCLVLLIALVALRILDPPPIEELRLRSFDFYQFVRPRVAEQRPVVILDIDESSLKELGQWPWPRTLIAELVRRLTEQGAVAIGFDIVFPEPDRMSPAIAAEAWELDEETRKKLRSLPSNDEALADAFRTSRIVVGQAGAASSSPQPDDDAAPRVGFATLGPDAQPFLLSFPGLLRNVPVLEQAAAGRGVFTIRPERDGVVRRVPLVVAAGGELTPAMTLDLLRVVTGAGALLIRSDEAGLRSVAMPGLEIPTDQNGQLWVHFAPHDRARFVPAIDLLRGRTPPDRFAGRLVLVGTSAIGLLDIKTTPVDAAIPGVEINAQIIENILANAALSRPNYAIGAELAALVLVGLGVVIVTPILGAATVFAMGGAVAALLIGASWHLYLRQGLLIDYTFPAFATASLYFSLVFANYFREQRQRQQIRSAFGLYLSPVLVEELARNPEKLVLGGEERRMTVLFSDVRGFAAISEHYRNNPQRLTSLMNRYLTPMTDAIIAHKGTVDKYIGDAIMAFWNAPLDDPQHELNACAAALDMLARLKRLNAEFEREAQETGERFIPFRIGVGVNTGQCVVGNMGSDFRFDYSVLGDSVNLASRLEGRSKDYGLPVVLGANTAAAAGEKFAITEIDLIQVKGKNEPEKVFTVLGREDLAASVRFAVLTKVNGEMLANFRSRRWTAALEAVAACRKLASELGLDALYDIYVDRIEFFRANPPPPEWNGVFVYDRK